MERASPGAVALLAPQAHQGGVYSLAKPDLSLVPASKALLTPGLPGPGSAPAQPLETATSTGAAPVQLKDS